MGLAKIMVYKMYTKETKRDIDGFRLNAGKLETIEKSFYLESGEKVMFNRDTQEVRMR